MCGCGGARRMRHVARQRSPHESGRPAQEYERRIAAWARWCGPLSLEHAGCKQACRTVGVRQLQAVMATSDLATRGDLLAVASMRIGARSRFSNMLRDWKLPLGVAFVLSLLVFSFVGRFVVGYDQTLVRTGMLSQPPSATYPLDTDNVVHGQMKVPASGQVLVPARGQPKVPASSTAT